MEQEQRTALTRGMITGLFTAGLTFFTTWQTGLGATDMSSENALLMAGVGAGVSFFATLVARFGGEGTIDAARGGSKS